jgi:hypothetical protein
MLMYYRAWWSVEAHRGGKRLLGTTAAHIVFFFLALQTTFFRAVIFSGQTATFFNLVRGSNFLVFFFFKTLFHDLSYSHM